MPQLARKETGCRHEAQTTQSAGAHTLSPGSVGKQGFLACFRGLSIQERINSCGVVSTIVIAHYYFFSPTDGAKGQLTETQFMSSQAGVQLVFVTPKPLTNHT